MFSRLYAAGYDRWTARLDRQGGEEHQRRLAEVAAGEVLEVFTGTGLNLRFYASAARVVALEPEPGMRQRAERRAQRAGVPVEVIDGDGMHLPFPDASFDTVVFGLVLCTIPAPARALSEAHRVLRPVLDRFEMPGLPRIVRPHVEGTAEPAGSTTDEGVAQST